MAEPPDPDRTVDDVRRPESLAGGSGLPRPDAASPGRLELLGEIARGGMGAVLKARDVDFGRDVAVKVLLEDHRDQADLYQRFLGEARTAGRLQHPGIAPVYTLGRMADGRPYFTMKLVEGRTLAALLAERKDPSADAARFLAVFEQVCQTVAYAHSKGVIHRDLKPANIMVGAFGEVQVMDWGLAKVLRRAAEPDGAVPVPSARAAGVDAAGGGAETRAGSVLGTPAYMAPEQARGENDRVDERADVFGLGAILCEILTGRPPFTGALALLRAGQADLADALARLNVCGADADLIGLAKRCLAAEPADRPGHAGAAAAAVTAHRESVERRLRQAEVANAEAKAQAVGERKRRRLRWALAGSVLLLLLTAAGAGLWYAWDRAARRVEEDAALRKAEAAAAAALARADQAKDEARKIEQAADEAAKDAPETPDAAKRVQALWQRAMDSTDEAEGVLRTALGAEKARGRLAAARRECETQCQRAESVARLLDALERARALDDGGRESGFDYESAAQSYAAALKAYGLDLSGPEAAATTAIRAERPAVRLALTAALDDWATFVLDDGPEAARLLRIADQADDDAWRRRFRAAAAVDDADALKRLADEAGRLDLPAGSADVLAHALMKHGARAEAAALLRQARRRHPADFWVHYDLGFCLNDADHPDQATLDEAIGSYWAAIALRPGLAGAHDNLGVALSAKGDLDGAVAEFRRAIELDDTLALPYSNLAAVLFLKGDLDGAVAAGKKSVELDPKGARAHANLGNALFAKGDVDGAVAAYRKSIEADPKYSGAYSNLGMVLLNKHDVDGAVAACTRAVELDPRQAKPRYNLGNALAARDDADGAVAAYRKAVELDPSFGLARNGLGAALLAQGKFAEARDVARRSLDLLGPDDSLRPKADEIFQLCERLLTLEAKLDRVLRGEQQPADSDESIGLIRVCQLQHRYAAAARVYRYALAADAGLADDPAEGERYNAAGYAALAGCGQGEDAKGLSEKERAGWRGQALEWLRADFTVLTKRLEDGKPDDGREVAQTLRDWQTDFALAGLRDAAELARLPADEQEACKKLWADVRAVLDKAESKK